MIIFLRDIPPETKKFEIATFINEVFADKSSTHIPIADVEFLSLQDVDSNPLETHGLVRILSKDVGKKVIKALNGTIFKERRITVCEYVIRSVSNDPRNKHPGIIIDFKEQRALDRRRKNIDVNRR